MAKKVCIYCPDGWHLPSYDEWWKMTSYYGKTGSISEFLEGDNAGKFAYKSLSKGGDFGFYARGGFRFSDGEFNYLFLVNLITQTIEYTPQN